MHRELLSTLSSSLSSSWFQDNPMFSLACHSLVFGAHSGRVLEVFNSALNMAFSEKSHPEEM